MPAYCASSGAVVLASQQFVDGSIFIRPATVEGKKKKILGKNKHLPESPEAALFHRQCLPRPCFSFYQRRFRRANCQANNLVSFEYLKWEVLLLGSALALNISICYPLKQPMLVHSGKEMYCQAQMKNNGSRSQLPLGCYVPCYYVCS